MKYSAYLRLERAIAASDRGAILERWRFGTRILNDPQMVTPKGHLRHGKLSQLIDDAKADGITLTEQEIQRRLQCARAYQTEAEIRESAHGFKNWDDLARAAFPPVQVPLGSDTEPYDPRDPDEKRRDAARELARRGQESAGQLSLFPDDTYGEMSTLAELAKYAAEMAQMTDRYARRDQERGEYLKALIDAVNGDMSKTWGDAQAALDAAASAP